MLLNCFLDRQLRLERYLCKGADTLYNERSYDGRKEGQEPGRDSDTGRGWCVFESSISTELIARLVAYPKMDDILHELPPKTFRLRSGNLPEEVKLDAGRDLIQRVEMVEGQISNAQFTGKGDQGKVQRMYKDLEG